MDCRQKNPQGESSGNCAPASLAQLNDSSGWLHSLKKLKKFIFIFHCPKSLLNKINYNNCFKLYLKIWIKCRLRHPIGQREYKGTWVAHAQWRGLTFLVLLYIFFFVFCSIFVEIFLFFIFVVQFWMLKRKLITTNCCEFRICMRWCIMFLCGPMLSSLEKQKQII